MYISGLHKSLQGSARQLYIYIPKASHETQASHARDMANIQRCPIDSLTNPRSCHTDATFIPFRLGITAINGEFDRCAAINNADSPWLGGVDLVNEQHAILQYLYVPVPETESLLNVTMFLGTQLGLPRRSDSQLALPL